MSSAISERVAQLDSIRRELHAIRGVGEGEEYRLFPPPNPGEVRAYERRAGRSFPPSFRSFLDLANGWRGFRQGWTLLGLRRRDTELFFREGLDERVLRALPDLVPEHELRSLSSREKTDPKVLSPSDHVVVGTDGRGSLLVLDDLRTKDSEPEVALVKYVWVQKRWPNLAAMLDEVIAEASKDLAKVKGIAEKAFAAADAKAEKAIKAAHGKKAKAKARAKKPRSLSLPGATPSMPKLRVVEIRPSKSSKKKSTKKSPAKKPSPKKK